MEYVIVKYIHYIGILVLMSCLVCEHVIFVTALTRKKLRKIAIVDGVLGFSAIVIFLSGASLVMWYGKPTDYYLSNWIFYFKVSIFLTAALLSFYPTRTYLRCWKGDLDEVVALPGIIKHIIRIEIVIVLIIPLLGTLMANGFGAIH